MVLCYLAIAPVQEAKVESASAAKTVVLGDCHSSIITSDGSLWTWGANNWGQRIGQGPLHQAQDRDLRVPGRRQERRQEPVREGEVHQGEELQVPDPEEERQQEAHGEEGVALSA